MHILRAPLPLKKQSWYDCGPLSHLENRYRLGAE